MAGIAVPTDDLPDSLKGQTVPQNDLPTMPRPAVGAGERNAPSYAEMDLAAIQAEYRKARKAGADDKTLASIADAYVKAEQSRGGFGLALDDTVRTLARGTIGGVGGSADEANAALTTGGGRLGDYTEALDYNRARDRYVDENFPAVATGLKVAGGVVSGIAAAPRLGIGLASTLGQNVLRSTLAGGGSGALEGFAAGEGGLENRSASAAVGGTIGSVLGAAFPVLGAGLKGGGRFLQAHLAPGTVDAERRAGEVIGQALNRSRLRPGGQTNIQSLDSFEDAGIRNATLADLSDELTSLTGAVSRSPGPGREIVGQFLRSRQEGDPTLARAGGGQWADIFDDITQLVSRSTSSKRAAESMIARRAEQATPLYDKVREFGDVGTDELRSLGKIPSMLAALKRGVNFAKQDGTLPGDYKLDLSKPLPIQVWLQAKEGIDDLIGAAMRSGEKGQARSLKIMQNRLIGELDAITQGTYQEARDNFAGNSAVINALERGKDILKRDVSAEDIQDVVRGFASQSEREAFKAGAAQAMRETVGRVGRKGNAAAKFLNRGDIQEKLQSLFDDPKDYQSFMTRMLGRDRQFRTYSELTGSQTAAREIADDDMLASIQGGAATDDILTAAATAGRAGVIRNLLGRLQDGSVRALNERTRETLAKMLTTNDPKQIERVIEVINAANLRAAERSSRNAGVTTGLIQSGVVQPVTSR